MKLPEIEVVAAKVHEAWIQTKLSQGITSRPTAEGVEQMVDYSLLPEDIKELDRSTVRAIFVAIEAVAQDERGGLEVTTAVPFMDILSI